MAKHNYSQYSNKKNENKVDTTPEVTVEIQNGVVADAATEEVEAPVTNVAETETTVDATAETKTETTTETNSGAVAKGVVTKCAKLNVRSKPSVDGDVVAVITLADKVTIDVDKSTDEWFKIRTADGVNGFCMRKFVNANI